MKYTVIWRPVAERTLAELWLAAADQAAVSAAADKLDADFKRDPFSVGESRLDATRIVFEEPLAVLVDVQPDDRTVSVLKVWRVHEPE